MSMQEHKIVVLGAMGAGKTTLVKSVANGSVVDTDVVNTDTTSDKITTTVAMDYGDVDLPNGDRLRLYGTPGQSRFDFIWSMLLEGASGVIVVLDATAPDNPMAVLPYLTLLSSHFRNLPAVIAFSKADQSDLKDLEPIGQLAARHLRPLPLVPFDARSRDEVLMLMDVLMGEVEAHDLIS